MNAKLLFLLIVAFLIGCQEEDMSPIEQGLYQAILEKHIWKNEVIMDEVITDNRSPERYSRATTLSFTATQSPHTIQDTLKDNSNNDTKSDKFTGRLREFWGDYDFNSADSTLILSYRIHDKIKTSLNLSTDSLIISTKYKILKLSEDELIIQMRNDSL